MKKLKAKTKAKVKAKTKHKVKGAVKKRFRKTGGGNIKRRKAMHSHILTKKNAKRKRHLVSGVYVDKADEPNIKEMLG